MNPGGAYDVAIIGGGLAGLAASILLAREGFSVVLFEKERYPFHKVCGEYISMESYGFLQGLGIPLGDMMLPVIRKLQLTAPNGSSFQTSLEQGGFGISRYQMDHKLAQIAKQEGVLLMEATKVQHVSGVHPFSIEASSLTFGQISIKATVCLAAYGKKANLDTKWKRGFLQQHAGLQNFIGVKYHGTTAWPEDTIGLHNFKDGYCGISKIEEGKYCLCYLTTAANLNRCNNDIGRMEKEVLSKNPHLHRIFNNMKIDTAFPVTISQINFHSRSQVENGILMLGDAAGMITPLCGNGMSIALHTAKLAAGCAKDLLQKKITQQEMEQRYIKEWKVHFAGRLQRGRFLQRFFGSRRLSNLFVATFRNLPFLAQPVVKLTHGKPF